MLCRRRRRLLRKRNISSSRHRSDNPMTTLGAKILSRFVQTTRETSHSGDGSVDQARATLLQLTPDIERTVQDKVVLDFGSGEGWYSLVFGKMGARKVYGVDIELPK